MLEGQERQERPERPERGAEQVFVGSMSTTLKGAYFLCG